MEQVDFNFILGDRMKKRGQSGGFGVTLTVVVAFVGLMIVIIIGLLALATLSGANLYTASRTTSTVTNESPAYINNTGGGYRLAQFNSGTRLSPAITQVINTTNQTGGAAQGYNATTPITSGNWTFDTGTWIITNATVNDLDNVSISYTYVLKGNAEISSQNANNNFTDGVGNISENVPAIFAILATLMVFAVIFILWAVFRKMDIGSDRGGL